jgi:hypothetical protein
MKKTMIIGASTHPDRYAYKAANMLVAKGHQIVNIGLKKGIVAGETIEPPTQIYSDIDTITLYINPIVQKSYYDYIIATHPRRVIFNPGTENEELEALLEAQNIAYIDACTLVLLTTGQY